MRRRPRARDRRALTGRAVCCIYHKPKAVGESSDESSSDDSGSDSDEAPDAGRGDDGAPPACGHAHGRRRARARPDAKAKRPPSPNAYEKVPRRRPGDGPAGPAA